MLCVRTENVWVFALSRSPAPPPESTLMVKCSSTCWRNSSCRFWQKRVLISRYSSKTERPRFFTLHFGQEFLDRIFPWKWTDRGRSIIGHHLPSLALYHIISPAGCIWSMLFTLHHCPPLWRKLLRRYELFAYSYTRRAYKLMGRMWINEYLVPGYSRCPQWTSVKRSQKLDDITYTSILYFLLIEQYYTKSVYISCAHLYPETTWI